MHLRLRFKKNDDNNYYQSASGGEHDQDFKSYLQPATLEECNLYLKKFNENKLTDFGQISNSESEMLFFFLDHEDETYHLVNPFLAEFHDGAMHVFYKATKKQFNFALHKNVIAYDAQDSWLHQSVSLGLTYGFWESIADGAFASSQAFNPIALVFPFVNGIIAGLLHYATEIYNYEKRFGVLPSPAVRENIAKQSAAFAFTAFAGTLGWEMGLLAAKFILVAAHVFPFGLLANVIVAMVCGFGMAMGTVAAEIAKERVLYGEVKSSAAHFGKLFLSSLVQGMVWWAIKIMPMPGPMIGFVKDLLKGIVAAVSVALLQAFVKPKESWQGLFKESAIVRAKITEEKAPDLNTQAADKKIKLKRKQKSSSAETEAQHHHLFMMGRKKSKKGLVEKKGVTQKEQRSPTNVGMI